MSVELVAWTTVAGTSQESLDCWAALLGRWTEPHRRYHGIGHLSAVLLFIDEYADHAADADAVRLAAWYHDAIYDPQASDNEERSAAMAQSQLGALGLPGERVDEVARLVRLTTGHDPAEGDRNGELLNDADLMVLASPPEAYVAYLNAIRDEYAHVSDADFQAGRTAVLDALLAVPRLYRLEALAPMQAAARRNMTAELSLLRPDPEDGAPSDAYLGGPGADAAAAGDADRHREGPPGPRVR